jgi:hypothetical protein
MAEATQAYLSENSPAMLVLEDARPAATPIDAGL